VEWWSGGVVEWWSGGRLIEQTTVLAFTATRRYCHTHGVCPFVRITVAIERTTGQTPFFKATHRKPDRCPKRKCPVPTERNSVVSGEGKEARWSGTGAGPVPQRRSESASHILCCRHRCFRRALEQGDKRRRILPRLFEALAIPSHALRAARDSPGRRADVRPGMILPCGRTQAASSQRTAGSESQHEAGLQGADTRLSAAYPARDDPAVRQDSSCVFAAHSGLRIAARSRTARSRAVDFSIG
jgi:hypothetical protein